MLENAIEAPVFSTVHGPLSGRGGSPSHVSLVVGRQLEERRQGGHPDRTKRRPTSKRSSASKSPVICDEMFFNETTLRWEGDNVDLTEFGLVESEEETTPRPRRVSSRLRQRWDQAQFCHEHDLATFFKTEDTSEAQRLFVEVDEKSARDYFRLLLVRESRRDSK